MKSPKCPDCSSENVKKSSAYYEQNQISTTGSVSGAGISTKGISVGGGTVEMISSSAALAKNAPPGGEAPVGCMRQFMIWVGSLLVLGIILPIAMDNLIGGFFYAIMSSIALSFLAYLIPHDHTKSKLEAADARERYTRQWYCLSCGRIFFVNSRKI